MGHIKEPQGIDFVINSRTLTKEEETAISKHIQAYRKKYSTKVVSSKRTTRVIAKKKITS